MLKALCSVDCQIETTPKVQIMRTDTYSRRGIRIMKSQTKKMFIELSVGVVATVLFVSLCYPDNEPNAHTNEAAIAASGLLHSAIGIG